MEKVKRGYSFMEETVDLIEKYRKDIIKNAKPGEPTAVSSLLEKIIYDHITDYFSKKEIENGVT